MSGGISAIKGFDYQATVILDLLFDHFDAHTSDAYVRPEGLDDLDLCWEENGIEHRQYVQIKKPVEDSSGKLNPTCWTLTKVISQLMGDALSNLTGNNYQQVWVLGDEVDDAVIQLTEAGLDAPRRSVNSYWTVIHRLARNCALKKIKKIKNSKELQEKLNKWPLSIKLSSNPDIAKTELIDAFSECAGVLGKLELFLEEYRTQVAILHTNLPDVLKRVNIRPMFGTEQEVEQRVYDRLSLRYQIQRTIIESTLFRNLRGFINDISKQPARSFTHEELDLELRCVWPHMSLIKDAPLLEPNHIFRQDLTNKFTVDFNGRAIEATGISGSGKTSLASEIIQHSNLVHPERQVYYSEVRPTTNLRDALAGIAFSIRRLGFLEPFSLVTKIGIPEEQIISDLAVNLSALSCETVLIIDLVEGTCSNAFARDIATFVRFSTSNRCRVIILGQESAMRHLSDYEKDEIDVSQVNVRGFKFEEFVKLVSCYHQNYDRGFLSEVYSQVTAGRETGLFAKLAHSLARSSSLIEMSKIVDRPADEILAYAEQHRFTKLSEPARTAADKLVCFALPFSRKEAEAVFPTDSIALAIRELITLGLLRRHDQQLFEMHETVRAGLENMIVPSIRISAHNRLSAWYYESGNVIAEILHLERAGNIVQAKQRAKEIFTQGESWSELYSYISRHKLMSFEDVINVIASIEKKIEGLWHLSEILNDIDEPINVDSLFSIISAHKRRYFSEHDWTLPIMRAILDFAPERLQELLVFSINESLDDNEIDFALSWLSIALMRSDKPIDRSTIRFFEEQSPSLKERMVKLLLNFTQRDSLRPAFSFISNQNYLAGNQQVKPNYILSVAINNRKDTVEFLAAIPQVDASKLALAKTALLGQIESFVLNKKGILRTQCVEILQEATEEDIVVENAIRVLIFLGESKVYDLLESFIMKDNALGVFAKTISAFVNSSTDRKKNEEKVMDIKLPLVQRYTALSVLATQGINLSSIYAKLQRLEEDPCGLVNMDLLLLMIFIQTPFPDAIPMLERLLIKGDTTAPEHSLAIAVVKFGELPYPSAIEMLIKSLNHSSPIIRLNSALVLAKKRNKKALPALLESYSKEGIENVAVVMAAAIVASGAETVTSLSGKFNSFPILIWKCILAGRLQDIAVADMLIEISSNKSNHWQLRRAAIMAAGRYPYEIATYKIAPIVFAESSPLTIDSSDNLLCHNVISFVIEDFGNQELNKIFSMGEVFFVDLFSEIFEIQWGQSISNYGVPEPKDAARWLYERLKYYSSPKNKIAADCILNELHIPLLHGAVMRSLRLNQKADIIETHFHHTSDVWSAMRCVIECIKATDDDKLSGRLKHQLQKMPFKNDVRLLRVIDDIRKRTTDRRVQSPKVSTPVSESSNQATSMTYEDATNLLLGKGGDFELKDDFILKDLTEQQCEELIFLANPINERSQYIEKFTPKVSFTRYGHQVSQKSSTSSGTSQTLSSTLRAGIVAANKWDLNIPWIEQVMEGFREKDFVSSLLKCLGNTGDDEQFYILLDRYENTIFTHICTNTYNSPILKFVDSRIVPIMNKYILSGTDALLEGLCLLTQSVISSDIDLTLNNILYRWSKRFDENQSSTVNPVALWRGFRYLTEHPRFQKIKGWQSLLEVVLHRDIRPHDKQSILRVLEKSPSSYVCMEAELFRYENWEHYWLDEVEKLDNAANESFRQLDDMLIT